MEEADSFSKTKIGRWINNRFGSNVTRIWNKSGKTVILQLGDGDTGKVKEITIEAGKKDKFDRKSEVDFLSVTIVNGDGTTRKTVENKRIIANRAYWIQSNGKLDERDYSAFEDRGKTKL